jgi:hypothetical protein
MTSQRPAAARVSAQSSDSGVTVASDSPDAQIRSLDPPEAGNRNESAPGYRRVVTVLNDKWRVIECRDGIQWILQSRDTRKAHATGVWRGRSYCRTKEALLRCASHAGEINSSATAILAALPDWIETRSVARNPEILPNPSLELPASAPAFPQPPLEQLPEQGSGTQPSGRASSLTHERADQLEFDFQASFSPSRA